MSLELSNTVLEKFEEFEDRCNKLGIPMLRGMGPAPSSASMSMGDGILGFDLKLQERRITETVANKISRLESSVIDYDRRIESAKATLKDNPGYEPTEKWIKDLEKNKEYEIKKLTSLKEKKKFNWYEENPGQIPFVSNELYLEGKQKVMNDMEHEFGHHIHQQLDVTNPRDFKYPPLEQELYRTANVAEKEAMKTRYGKTNSMEWFAENYALYMTDHKDLLTDTALNLVKRIDKRQS